MNPFRGWSSVAGIAMSVCVLAQMPVANSAELVHPLPVGSKIPDSDLRTMQGQRVRLRKALRGKPTVLIFYRGGWCPFCNAQLSGLVPLEAEIHACGYQVVAISPDRPEELRKMADKDKLDYCLLSDSKAVALKNFGVAFKLDDGTMARMSSFGVDLEKSTGEKDHILPVPSVFLIDTEGKIVFAYSNPDYKVRLKPEGLMAAIKSNSHR